MDVDFKAGLVFKTPALYSGGVSADKMQLSDLFVLDGLIANSGGTATLVSVSCVDIDKRNTAFDILFFRGTPTIASTKGSTLDISDAEMIAKCLGKISFASGDFGDLANCSLATLRASSCGLKLEALEGDTKITAVIQSKGVSGSAYGAAGLTFAVGSDQD